QRAEPQLGATKSSVRAARSPLATLPHAAAAALPRSAARVGDGGHRRPARAGSGDTLHARPDRATRRDLAESAGAGRAARAAATRAPAGHRRALAGAVREPEKADAERPRVAVSKHLIGHGGRRDGERDLAEALAAAQGNEHRYRARPGPEPLGCDRLPRDGRDDRFRMRLENRVAKKPCCEHATSAAVTRVVR